MAAFSPAIASARSEVRRGNFRQIRLITACRSSRTPGKFSSGNISEIWESIDTFS
jgi:hypothetical protein